MKKFIIAIAVVFLLLPAGKAAAQGCVVCTNTASQLDDKSAKGMNNGIIYLAAFPFSIIATIGFLWWRSKKQEQ